MSSTLSRCRQYVNSIHSINGAESNLLPWSASPSSSSEQPPHNLLVSYKVSGAIECIYICIYIYIYWCGFHFRYCLNFNSIQPSFVYSLPFQPILIRNPWYVPVYWPELIKSDLYTFFFSLYLCINRSLSVFILTIMSTWIFCFSDILMFKWFQEVKFKFKKFKISRIINIFQVYFKDIRYRKLLSI